MPILGASAVGLVPQLPGRPVPTRQDATFGVVPAPLPAGQAPYFWAMGQVGGAVTSRVFTAPAYIPTTQQGDTLLLCFNVASATMTVSAVVDSAGNTYTLDSSFTTTSPQQLNYRAANANPIGPGTTVTATTSATSANLCLSAGCVPAAYWSGVDVIDAVTTGTGLQSFTHSITPTQDNELILFANINQSIGGPVYTQPPFFGQWFNTAVPGTNEVTWSYLACGAGTAGVAQSCTVNFGQTNNGKMGGWSFTRRPKMSTLQDSFPGTSVNATLWNSFPSSGGSVSVSGGLLSLTDTASTAAFSVLQSVSTYDLTSSYLYVQLASAGTQATNTLALMKMQVDANTSVQILVQNGTIAAQHQVTGAYGALLGSQTYSAATHKWLRIRESGGTLFYEYSADGNTWSTLYSEANPFPLVSLQVSLQEGSTGTTDPVATSQWANVNTPAVLIPSAVFVIAERSPVGTTGFRRLARTNAFAFAPTVPVFAIQFTSAVRARPMTRSVPARRPVFVPQPPIIALKPVIAVRARPTTRNVPARRPVFLPPPLVVAPKPISAYRVPVRPRRAAGFIVGRGGIVVVPKFVNAVRARPTARNVPVRRTVFVTPPPIIAPKPISAVRPPSKPTGVRAAGFKGVVTVPVGVIVPQFINAIRARLTGRRPAAVKGAAFVTPTAVIAPQQVRAVRPPPATRKPVVIKAVRVVPPQALGATWVGAADRPPYQVKKRPAAYRGGMPPAIVAPQFTTAKRPATRKRFAAIRATFGSTLGPVVGPVVPGRVRPPRPMQPTRRPFAFFKQVRIPVPPPIVPGRVSDRQSLRQIIKRIPRYPFKLFGFIPPPVVLRPPQHLGGTAIDQNFLGGNAVNANAPKTGLGGTAVNANALGGSPPVRQNFLGGTVAGNQLGGTATGNVLSATLEGWTMIQQDITVGQYNDETIALTITNGTGPSPPALNLTGLVLEAYLKPTQASLDTDAGVYKLSTATGEIVVTNATGGLANMAIAAADLNLTTTPAFWRLDAVSAGKRNTIMYGAVHITDL